jgi:hypothetical protein
MQVMLPASDVAAPAHTRVMPHAGGTLYAFSMHQTPDIPDEVFDAQVAELERELTVPQGASGDRVPAVEISPSVVAAAVGGDQRALEQLLHAVAGDVRRVAQRMLWHPQDAEDATQEILVKVATRLSTFRATPA